jgi:hypothetical protein
MRDLALVLVVVVFTGCASVPVGPSVMALPGAGKSFEQFQADDAACRQWAQQQTGTAPGGLATQNTIGGATIGTLLGAGVGAAIGAASGHPGTGAAVGAGAGLLGGTAVGASAGQTAGASVQHRYDNAYQQCMYAKGNQIQSRARVAAPRVTPPPPPPPASGQLWRVLRCEPVISSVEVLAVSIFGGAPTERSRAR